MARKLKRFTLIIVSASFLFLSACSKSSEDPNLKITQIAQTVQADLTQIAELTPLATVTFTPTMTSTINPVTVTPTFQGTVMTPTVTATVLKTSGDNSRFDSDVTIPDGTMVASGSTFVKTWKFTNNGSTTWNTNYKLMYLEGQTATNNTLFVNVPKSVTPGESIDISVTFTAPAEVGSYYSKWVLYNAEGYTFGEYCSIQFSVGTFTPSPTSNVTATGGPTATVSSTP